MNDGLTAFAAARTMRAASAPEALLGPAAGTADAAVAAREFAGLFYSMMLSAMGETVGENPYFGGHGEEMFMGMWLKELGRHMAWRTDDPLAGMILKGIARDARPGGPAPVAGTSTAGEQG